MSASSVETVLAAFEGLEDTTDKATMETFVADYFEGPNLEFETYEPTDWKEK